MPPLQSPPIPPRYDATVERRADPKHVFDRDPLLIPKLFVDPGPPWYKRKRWQLALVVSVGVVSAVGVLVAQRGPRGAMATLGRAGVGVMHVYTRLVASPDFSEPQRR